MNRLAWQCAATIAWMVVVAEIDRHSRWLEMGAPGYAFAGVGIALLVVPRLRRISVLWVLALAFPAFFLVRLLDSGVLDPRTAAVSLLEFGAAGMTVFLATRLARRLAMAEDVIRELAVGPARPGAEPFSRSQGEMFRELRRARRYERPLSLLAVSVSKAQPPAALGVLLEQARRESLDRYVAARLGLLLDRETSGSTVIAERKDHFLLLLPETGAEEAERLAARLRRAAGECYGMELHFGVASFPHPELTFDKLLETAESGQRSAEAGAGPMQASSPTSRLAPSPGAGS